jgi:hypothetical protein
MTFSNLAKCKTLCNIYRPEFSESFGRPLVFFHSAEIFLTSLGVRTNEEPYFWPIWSAAHHRDTVATLHPIRFEASVAVIPIGSMITPVKRFANISMGDYT